MTKKMKRRTKKTTLTADFLPLRTRRSNLVRLISRFVPSLLLFVGLYVLMLPFKASVGWLELMPFVMGVFMVSILAVFKHYFPKAKLWWWGIGLVYLLIISLFYQHVVNGFLQLLNHQLAVSGQLKGYYYFGFTAVKRPGDVLLFSMLFAVLLALWANVISVSHHKILLVMTWLFVITYVILTKVPPTVLALASLFGGTLFISILPPAVERSGSREQTSQFRSLTGMASLLLLLVGLIYFLLGANGVDELTAVSVLKEKSNQMMTHLRYEKKRKPSLPRGKLRGYEEKRGRQEVLTAKLTHIEPLYLKSFVGAHYADDQWADLTAQERYNSRPLLYWLDKEGFSSFSQLAELNQLVSSKKLPENIVTITNKQGNSQTLLMAYGAVLDESDQNEGKDDHSVYSRGLKGERAYTYHVMPNALTEYPQLVNEYAKLKDATKNAEQRAYLKNEANYNEFVYEHYLGNTTELIDQEAGFSKGQKSDGRHAYYEEADQQVTDYFADYQAKKGEKNKRTAIAKNFIALSTSGDRVLSYDVEYATIGTLIYRSLGIPARYVEGYLVRPEKSSTVKVTEKDAHAWVEIYQDGVGWVPKEPMPEYHEVMPKPQFTGITHKGDDEKQDGEEQHQKESLTDPGVDAISEEEQKKEEVARQKQAQRKQQAFIFLGVLMGIMLVVIVAQLIRFSYQRMVRAKKERQLRQNKDSLTASLAIFREMLALLALDGIKIAGGSLYDYQEQLETQYSAAYSRLYGRVVKGIQTAVYSEGQISPKVKELAEQLLNQTTVLVIESKPVRQRMLIKFRRFKNH